MPIYEYLCEDCGKVTESLQKLNDPPPKSCGECGGKHLAKLVSRSAFQLKGGGWYSDLYASPKKPAETPAAKADGEKKAEPSAPAPAPAKTEAPAERKPAAAAKPEPAKKGRAGTAGK
ncbi:MAG TPA: zinc ribbon domain-containing protein [Anaeromyxobacteraceae bacterium]|nr:zinc ribbon domain-containing protein [Anaeromyxobacteraceae bacterium]